MGRHLIVLHWLILIEKSRILEIACGFISSDIKTTRISSALIRTTSDPPPPPPPPAPPQNHHSRLSLLHILYPRIKLGLTSFAAFSLLSHRLTVSQHHCSTPPIHHHHWPCLSSPNIGEQKLKDFDIEREAKGVDKVVKINFKAIVKDKSLEIRFHYAEKGTTAVLMRGIYGPLISAISVKSGK
ncbi:hypothetical protein LguiA_033149 [Lonicera macranthoides]